MLRQVPGCYVATGCMLGNVLFSMPRTAFWRVSTTPAAVYPSVAERAMVTNRGGVAAWALSHALNGASAADRASALDTGWCGHVAQRTVSYSCSAGEGV